MKREKTVFATRPVQQEAITAKQYIGLSSAEKRNIASTQVIAPRLGAADFGKLFVKYRVPVYKVIG